MKLLLTLLCTLWAYILFAQDTTSVVNPSTGKVETYIRYDQMPQPDYDVNKYISSHVQYPAALKDHIKGRINIHFRVAADGSITEAKALKPLHPLLDAEAIRVVNAMPRWKPATYNGKKVVSYYTLPVYME